MVPAAGQGKRLGAGLPKALVPVRGVPLLVHAVRGLLNTRRIIRVVVAAPETHLTVFRSVLTEFDSMVQVIPGGAERIDSVRFALTAAVAQAPDARFVLVHDAARAFTPPEVINSVIAALHSGQRAVIPVLPVSDTMRHIDESGLAAEIVDRSTLRFVQTPQGFDVKLLYCAHQQAAANLTAATDDATLVEHLGEPISTVAGHAYAMKITTPFDLLIAEAILTKDSS